jgi:Zinc dependent phospholipase C
MPSLGIHLLVAEQAFGTLSMSPDNDVKSLQPIVKYFPEMAALGAIGPDLLYYIGEGPKISAAVIDVFHFLNQITGILGEVANVANQFGFPNVRNRVQQLADIAALAIGTAQSGLLAAAVTVNEVVTGSHLFNPSAAQKGQPETDWNWGDLLHDRISGTFANTLLKQARTSSNYPQMAYATGYMTHLATDFVGHAYVNTVVGGPARGWNMRHTLAEKFMDASVFWRAGRDINSSKLHERFSSLSGSPQLGGLKTTLSAMIGDLSRDTSLPFKLPSPCSSDEIGTAFDSMCSLFRLVTEDGFVPPPKGPGIAIPPIPGQYGSLTNSVLNIPPPGRPRTISDWLKWLLAFLLLAPAILADMVRFVGDAAVGIITYPLAAAAYVFQCYLYSVYRSVRWFLVISGVLFPCTDELTNPLGLQFAESRGHNDDSYPHIPPDINKWIERLQAITFTANNYDYLNYPRTPGEHPSTIVSPYPKGTTPEFFMFELKRDDQFIQSWRAVPTPAALRTLVSSISLTPPYRGGFGNAVDLSVYFLGNPDVVKMINLDSDRGYAYRQWTCSGGIPTGNITGEKFI